MPKLSYALAMLPVMLLMACGPDTIFVRPGLDTPAQHVYNGHQLLERGKIDDACREFNRAKELDPNYFKAYIGLGVALGRKGEIEAGMQVLEQAEELTVNRQGRAEIQDGYRQLMEMRDRKETKSQSP